MIVVTGAAGFIGSALVWGLNEAGCKDIIAVDELGTDDKWMNLRKRTVADFIHKEHFLDWIHNSPDSNNVEIIVHMGACSATTEKNADYLLENNYQYSKSIWEWCVRRGRRFIYASSAATYGAGESGFDDCKPILGLKPLNAYGYSKQLFDVWVENQVNKPTQYVGLKFFNVFGPNEYHKGDMASVIYHAYNQIVSEGRVKLYKSYLQSCPDGGQSRDFIYVKDVIKVIQFLLTQTGINGIYNVGTGVSRTFNSLVNAVFDAMRLPPNIGYIDMPDVLREKYQYYTQSSMTKLQDVGYQEPFFTLEYGVSDYVQTYLMADDKYL